MYLAIFLEFVPKTIKFRQTCYCNTLLEDINNALTKKCYELKFEKKGISWA